MKQIKFKGNPVTLVGNQPKIGDTIEIKATNTDFSDFTMSKGKRKVISMFPSINTSVCDEQTQKIIALSSRYPNYDFISISLDLPPAQRNWCASTGHQGIMIVSDYKDRDFAKKYGLLIDELKLLARGIMVLNEENKLTYLEILEEVAELPNFNNLDQVLQAP